MIRPRIVSTRRADEDLEGAVDFYGVEGGRRTADDFVDALDRCLAILRDHPSIGSPRFAVELGVPELRSVAIQGYPYLIFYAEDPDAIRILRVLHTARDIPAEFADR